MSDPNEKIRYRSDGMYGQAIYMGRRTAAHLDWTRERLAAEYPGHDIVIIQGAFNTSVSASAGTHDYDACLDVYIPGWSFTDMQAFLRRKLWGAFYRYPPLFGYHIHMISLGYGTARVGTYIPGQVSDYYSHRTGLVGHYSDSSWHPDPITVFDYPAYERGRLEADMPTTEELLSAKLGKNATVRDALLAALDTKEALAIARANTIDRDRALAADLDKLLLAAKDDATRTDLAKLRARLLENHGAKDTTK